VAREKLVRRRSLVPLVGSVSALPLIMVIKSGEGAWDLSVDARRVEPNAVCDSCGAEEYGGYRLAIISIAAALFVEFPEVFS